MDRLIDEGHAILVGAITSTLRRLEWEVEVEVSFSSYGDRGSIDVLAWHRLSRTLWSLRSRLSSVLSKACCVHSTSRSGWRARSRRNVSDGAPSRLAGCLLLPEDRTARRAVARHRQVFDSALPARTREVRKWLATPEGALAGLMFLTSSQLVGTKRNPSAVKRVRSPVPRSEQAQADRLISSAAQQLGNCQLASGALPTSWANGRNGPVTCCSGVSSAREVHGRSRGTDRLRREQRPAWPRSTACRSRLAVLSGRRRTMRGKRSANPESWRFERLDHVEGDLDHDRSARPRGSGRSAGACAPRTRRVISAISASVRPL